MAPNSFSKALYLCAYADNVPLDFSRPGKTTKNAYIESFNSLVRNSAFGLISLDTCLEDAVWRSSVSNALVQSGLDEVAQLTN